jgi:hypothetical protein
MNEDKIRRFRTERVEQWLDNKVKWSSSNPPSPHYEVTDDSPLCCQERFEPPDSEFSDSDSAEEADKDDDDDDDDDEECGVNYDPEDLSTILKSL